MDTTAHPCPAAPPARILLVDDHPNTALTLARAISRAREGVEVMSATSGQQALEFARNGSIDILITDMMMPGMNGFELIERLRSHPAGRPAHTILMTAYDVPGLKETARRLHVQDTLIKPVPTERICQLVNQVLDNMLSKNGQAEKVVSLQQFKILVADDAPDNVTLLSRYMMSEGYEYTTASNGVEVLEKARLEMPDLILLDVNMPEKDGFTALRELRSDPDISHIPVIILTAAYPRPGDIHWGLNLGADDYITKPFDKRELLARIRTKLRVKATEDVIRRHNREWRVLPEIGKELSASLDVNRLTEVVLQRSVETVAAMMGHLILLDPGSPIHRKYFRTRPEPSSPAINFPPLNDLVEQIKHSRQGLIIADTQADPHWQTVPDNPALSVIMVPMFGRLDLIGLLILAHEQTGFFKLDHLLLLQAIASQAAIAVENSRLYERMAQEQGRLAAVLQAAADAIMMFDADGCLSLLNASAERLFAGYQLKLGLPLARKCGYDGLIGSLEEVLASGTSKTEEILWSDQRVFSASFTYIETGGCVVLLHDVSHFKALERVKDEFISAASHDLRNPIMAISGFTQLLPAAGPLNEQQNEFVHRILFASASMKELVENLLDLAKIDAGTAFSRETVVINELLAEIAQEFEPQAEAKGQKFTLNISQLQPQVQGDPFQLKQALRNLTGNAIKYTQSGGTIDLSVTTEPAAVQILVRDNGYGIPPEHLPHIFDRFYRVRDGVVKEVMGSGLGLAIVKSVVEAHGGRVSVESEPGKGSCFVMMLPLSQEAYPDRERIRLLETQHAFQGK